MYYELQTLHDGKWTNDPSLLGDGCTEEDNRWDSYGNAAIAYYELVTFAGFDALSLRINRVETDDDG